MKVLERQASGREAEEKLIGNMTGSTGTHLERWLRPEKFKRIIPILQFEW